MYRKILAVAVMSLLFAGATEAQYIVNKFRVNFTDKANSPYSISNPSAFLSPKAIARRTAQGIPIVQNDLPVNPWYIDSVRNTGVTILNPSKWFNCVTIMTTDSSKIAHIQTFNFVQSIDSLADTPLKKGAKRILKNADTMKQGTQSLEIPIMEPSIVQSEPIAPSNVKVFDYGPAYTQVHMLATDYLHDQGFRGQGMTIAVLDAGFYSVNSLAMFDSLFYNNQILGTKDFVLPGNNVYTAGTHGMMVLSTMGGNVPGELIGTAPKANYWLLRTEDSNTEYPIEEDNWASGAEFADSVGADVINSSLGYTNFDNPDWSHTYADMNGHTCRSSRAAMIAASKGMIVVNSAGNSGADPWNYIGAPADADSILSVGAVDGAGIYASFSSNGPSVDSRVKPDVCAMGQNTIVVSTSGSVMPGNGTSFASPVMAGSVACLWQANPGFKNYQLIEVIKQSANHYMNPDTLYGYGIPNMAAANLILSQKKIHNFDMENQINVLPNPFVDHFSIIFYSTANMKLSIELFDQSGKSVYKQENINRETGYNYYAVKDLEGLQTGVYVLKVVSGDAVYTNKLMKTE
jgi:subtilisin family serine protease